MPDFLGYTAPGVYITEDRTPLVSVVGTTTSVVAIVGPSVGYRTWSETVTLNGTTAVPLAKTGVDGLTVVVKHTNGTALVKDTDFTLTTSGGEDGNAGTPRDNVTSLARIAGQGITDGETVSVTYRYTDNAYFDPARFNDYDTAKDAYGEPIDPTTSAITSPLTLAAKIAFDNGASQVILVPTDGSAESTSRAELAAALLKLDAVYDLAVVVPLPVGVSGTQLDPGEVPLIGQDLKTHCEARSDEGYYRVGVIGYDKDITVPPVTIASSIASERVMLAWPNKMTWFNGLANQSVEIGGYYLAAAYAGALVAQPVQNGLTKRVIRGFSGIPASVFSTMNKSTKDTWSAGGVAVTEATRSGSLVCRHGVSTLSDTQMHREVSLTRSRDTMMRLLQDTLDNSGMVGTAIQEETPLRVKGVVQGVLEQLALQEIILAYTDLKARQRPTEPSVIEVKFAYRPAYPLNYILVSFSVDTTTGAVA